MALKCVRLSRNLPLGKYTAGTPEFSSEHREESGSFCLAGVDAYFSTNAHLFNHEVGGAVVQ